MGKMLDFSSEQLWGSLMGKMLDFALEMLSGFDLEKL